MYPKLLSSCLHVHQYFPLMSCVLVAANLAAQTSVSLPTHAPSAEGMNATTVPFGLVGFRTQFLLDAAAIAPNGAVLSALRFRADRTSVPLAAASVPNVTVSISQTSVALPSMSPTFANNVTQAPAIVFQGTMSLPGYTTAGFGPLPWDIVIPFNSPWPMTTSLGNVLVEITANNPPNSTPIYFVDGIQPGGATTEFGRAGDYPSDDLELNVAHGLSATNLSPGHTIQFWSSLSVASQPGLFALGFAPQPLPIDLAPFGAPTHTLYVDPIVLQPHSWVQTVFFGWVSQYALVVPNDPTLVGAMLYAQSSVFDPTANALGLVLSAAEEVRIGDEFEVLPLRQVAANDPALNVGSLMDGKETAPVLLEGSFF